MNPENQLILLSDSPYDTPNPFNALNDPEGLVAVGGDLSSERLVHLYSHGFFPWYCEPEPILWWHPKERCVLFPEQFHLSRSSRKSIIKNNWHIKFNSQFKAVIQRCAQHREQKEGTWISNDIQEAYLVLHQLGYAHSIEVWQGSTLVGGFYGVAIGSVFFGESMFSEQKNASKTALFYLCQQAKNLGIELIDCQVESAHLISLGASLINRERFLHTLERLIPSNRPLESLQKMDNTIPHYYHKLLNQA